MGVKTSVLYFDDEPVLLDTFRETFARDYDVLTAPTLSEARRILSRCPDVIISDMNMPEISGTEFLREAMKLCPESYRILLTGHVGILDVMGEVTSGVIQVFISKPWDAAGVRLAIERAAPARPRE